MIWKTECDRVRQHLPLLAGHDLPPGDEAAIGLHVRQCPSCRRLLTDLNASQSVLEEVRGLRPAETGPSLWTDLQPALASAWVRPIRSPAGWIPVGALAAACAAMLLIGLFGPSFEDAGFIHNWQVRNSSEGPDRSVQPVSLHRHDLQRPRQVRSRHFSDSTTY